MNGNINNYMPVKVISGRNCVRQNSDLFGAFGKKCLIVTGGGSAQKSGALRDCSSVLLQNGIIYSVFNGIEPNPTAESCRRAGTEAHDYNVDFIVGIGGGSVMDAAKAVAIFACCPDMDADGIYDRTVPSARLPLILIGTTAGTGSEVTGVSVLTNRENGRKKSISGKDCYADIAFCDYGYTMSAPFDITVSTALDAFCHAAEAYLASPYNDLTDIYAETALRLLSDFVVSPTEDALDEELRKKLYLGSVFAGYAINIAGTDFPHTIGYYLTENYGIPHGRACAAFTSVLLERAHKFTPEKLAALCETVGFDYKELGERIKSAAAVNVKIERDEAENAARRWSAGVKNFDRSPGGFTSANAVDALCSLC